MKKHSIQKSGKEFNLPFALFTIGIQVWMTYLSFVERGSFKIGGEWLIIPLLFIGKNLFTQILRQINEDIKELKGFLAKNTGKPQRNLVYNLNHRMKTERYEGRKSLYYTAKPYNTKTEYFKNVELQSRECHLQAS